MRLDAGLSAAVPVALSVSRVLIHLARLRDVAQVRVTTRSACGRSRPAAQPPAGSRGCRSGFHRLLERCLLERSGVVVDGANRTVGHERRRRVPGRLPPRPAVRAARLVGWVHAGMVVGVRRAGRGPRAARRRPGRPGWQLHPASVAGQQCGGTAVRWWLLVGPGLRRGDGAQLRRPGREVPVQAGPAIPDVLTIFATVFPVSRRQAAWASWWGLTRTGRPIRRPLAVARERACAGRPREAGGGGAGVTAHRGQETPARPSRACRCATSCCVVPTWDSWCRRVRTGRRSRGMSITNCITGRFPAV